MATAPTLPTALNPVTVADLTTALDGQGIFDVLMRTSKAHLQQEYDQNRIKGAEFSTVYLGSLQAVLSTSLQFLMQKTEANQGALLKAKQLTLMDTQQEIAEQQLLQTAAQTLQIEAQTAILATQKALMEAQKLQVQAETLLTNQKTENALIEKDVLIAQKCKLQAEFDVLMLTKPKTQAETSLLEQKIVTEKAQVTELGVDENSVVGRQKQLYVAQATGFSRDAEQKAAKILVDSWNVRRTTDEGTSANTTNRLDDATVGLAVDKLLVGVGAV